MNSLKTFLSSLPHPTSFLEYGVYEASLNTIGQDCVFMVDAIEKDVIVATGNLSKQFQGNIIQEGPFTYAICDLTHENASVLRSLFPFTKAIPVLNKKRSFGLGDRLGIAGEGHLNIFKKYDAYPILAQQSIRELTLTHRTYEDVMDAASFAVYKAGYKDGFGADGDHLKKPEEIEYALGLGFTMITLDASDYIRNDVSHMDDEAVLKEALLSDYDQSHYLNQTFHVEGIPIHFDELSLKKTVLIYGKAIDYAVKIYQTYFINGKADANFEVSIDETATPTEPYQHYYVASELSRRGVKLDTMAPRFCGEFQKGVDYVGDIKQFDDELKVHVAIAKTFGYKLSIHSGSDKFSIFEIIGKHTEGHFHVKTAGTNWLEAMRVVSQKNPSLYRKIHAYALSMFNEAKKFYHVSTDIKRIPNLETLKDSELPSLFEHNDARQLIHITYGYILNVKNEVGAYMFKDELFKLWRVERKTYAEYLEKHIGKHLSLLYKGFKGE
jgi:hypothetical protein